MAVPLEFCGAASGSWFDDDRYVPPAPVRFVTVNVALAFVVLENLRLIEHCPAALVVQVVVLLAPPPEPAGLHDRLTTTPDNGLWDWSCTVTVTWACQVVAFTLLALQSRSPTCLLLTAAWTVMVNDWSAAAAGNGVPESVARTVTLCEGACPAAGVHEITPVALSMVIPVGLVMSE